MPLTSHEANDLLLMELGARSRYVETFGAIESHWRSKTITLKQATDHFGQLPSGVPWTFVKNSTKMVKTVLLDAKELLLAVAGGEALALECACPA